MGGLAPEAWICVILAAANSVQYVRDWRRESRYQKEIAKRDTALAEAQARHRTDLITMIPALTRVLDFMKQ